MKPDFGNFGAELAGGWGWGWGLGLGLGWGWLAGAGGWVSDRFCVLVSD